MLKVRKIRGYFKILCFIEPNIHTFSKATTHETQKCNQDVKPILANLLCQPVVDVSSQGIPISHELGQTLFTTLYYHITH